MIFSRLWVYSERAICDRGTYLMPHRGVLLNNIFIVWVIGFIHAMILAPPPPCIREGVNHHLESGNRCPISGENIWGLE